MSLVNRFLLLFLAFFVSAPFASSPGRAADPAAALSDSELAALLDATDDLMRGDSSHATFTMTVHTSHWDRSMSIEVWTKGQDRSLLRILEPAKERGMATLKVEDNIWNYLPKVDRTMKVPAAMMSSNWMGSHFTNDDLVKESRLVDDYDFQLVSAPPNDPDGRYVVDLRPKPDAPVVWGKVTLVLDGQTRLPVEMRYYDERDNLKRTMSFSDVQDLGGRTIPMHMRLVPEDKPEEFTDIHYSGITFNLDIPDSTFTLQALKP